MTRLLPALAAVLALALALPAARADTPRVTDHLNRGDYDAARAAMSAQVAGHPQAAILGAYLEAQILLRQNRPEAALSVFRQILDAAPEFEPARRELALILAARGDLSASSFHAQKLASSTRDSELRESMQALLLRVSGGPRQGVAFRFSILPSTNLTRLTAAEEVFIGDTPFRLDPGSRASTGVALAFGATAWRRWHLGERWSMLGTFALDTKIYPELLPVETTAVGRLSLIRSSATRSLSFGPVVEASFADEARVRRRFGLEANGAMRLPSGGTLTGGLRWDLQDHDRLSYRDGHRVQARLGYHVPLDARTYLSLGAAFLEERTKRRYLDHEQASLSVGLQRKFPSGMTLDLSLEAARDRFKADYPGFAVPRRDKVATLTVGLSHKRFRIGSLTPRFTYSYTRSRSSVPLFDYESHDVGIGFVQRF